MCIATLSQQFFFITTMREKKKSCLEVSINLFNLYKQVFVTVNYLINQADERH